MPNRFRPLRQLIWLWLTSQFNALPEELLDFVQQLVTEHSLRIVRITFPPFHAEEISRESLSGAFANTSNGQEFAFTLQRTTASRERPNAILRQKS